MSVEERFMSLWQAYPEGWPMCAFCRLPVLDGHLTCGRSCCDEARARDLLAAVSNRERLGEDLAVSLQWMIEELRTRTPSGPQEGTR